MLFFKKSRLTTTQMIAYGFLIAILVGTLLLMLPIATKSGESTPFIDALFTATTSICVTGLTTVVTIEHWNLFGQVVILGLIQFGGLGVITFTTTILMALRKRITLKDRLLIQEAYNLDTLKGLVKLTIKIIKGTLFIEGIGAVLFSIQFIPEFGFLSGIWKSVFHAISAFCNAGIDLIGTSSFEPYRSNIIVNFTTMTLIILGGIGFPVWWDVVTKVIRMKREKLGVKKLFRKLELHSKIVLTVTIFLIVFGAVFYFCNEFYNMETIGGLPLWEKAMASLFQSVTLRTAGFFTVAQEGMKPGTAFVGIILMFIGGSPSGTAGGIKTVTIAVILLSTLSMIRGKADVEVFHRKLADSYVKKSLCIMMISMIVLFSGVIALSLAENAVFLDILYEVTSALATVGLTRNLTMSLSTIGKIIIIICMYIGRIGPITMALAFNMRKERNKRATLPEEKILV